MKIFKYWPLFIIIIVTFILPAAMAQPSKGQPSRLKLSKPMIRNNALKSKVKTTTTLSTKTQPTGPAPQIACDKPEFNFGTAAKGEDVKHVFTLKNKGKGVLKIERARGG